MIKVLVVDDSAFMRNSLSMMLKTDPSIEVVGHAKNGIEAIEQVEKLNPDVITMDVEMPGMDGLAALEKIMKTSPRPVLMVSSLTSAGAESTLRALDLGALDYLPKYQEGSVQFAIVQQELVNKVKAISKRRTVMRLSQFAPKPKKDITASTKALEESGLSHLLAKKPAQQKGPVKKIAPPVDTSGTPKRNIVVIGVSTGGPPAVQKVLAALPANFPACILIAQHMPKAFTGAFAKRLASLSKIKVTEAQDGDKIVNGHAYVCPGGQHISIAYTGSLPYIKVSDEPKDALYKPAANILNESAAVMGSKVVGLTMTGMGSDGVLGTKVLKSKGGYIIAQDEASSVVYGMPRAVVDANLADEIVDIDQLADTLQKALYR